MLILSRKREQEIRIGDAVVKVVAIKGGRVQLGIEAPPSVKVLRTEVERNGKGQ